MDLVFIEDLRIETVIGIYDWERKIRQVVALDLRWRSTTASRRRATTSAIH
jgi:dihydroneopterin aldolase